MPPRKRKQGSKLQQSKSQGQFEQPEKKKFSGKQKRTSKIQGSKNQTMDEEEIDETIFYDETSSQQISQKDKDHSKSISGESQPSLNIKRMNSSQQNDQISKRTRNSLAVQKKLAEKENKYLSEEEEEMYKESNTEAQVLKNQQKLQQIFSTGSNLLNNEDLKQSELIDSQHFSFVNNKGISKYGNKTGRKCTNQKDHNIPLDDKDLMEELFQILLDYEYNIKGNFHQSGNFFSKQEANFYDQSTVKNEFDPNQQFMSYQQQNQQQFSSQQIKDESMMVAQDQNFYLNQENNENFYQATNNISFELKNENEIENFQSFIDEQPIYNEQINKSNLLNNENFENISHSSNFNNQGQEQPYDYHLNNSSLNSNNQGQTFQNTYQHGSIYNEMNQPQNQSYLQNKQPNPFIFQNFEKNFWENEAEQSKENSENLNYQGYQMQHTFMDSQNLNLSKIEEKQTLDYTNLLSQQNYQKSSTQMVDKDVQKILTPQLTTLRQLEQELRIQKQQQNETKSENELRIQKHLQNETKSENELRIQKDTQNETKSENKQSRSYRMVEDLKILYIMSQKQIIINGFSSKYWSIVVKLNIIERPHESLRDRYKRFLKYLNKDNIIDIFKWIRRNNTIYGYLYFLTENPNNKFKIFSHVSQEDPFASKKQHFSGQSVKDLRENKSISLENSQSYESGEQIVKKEEKQQQLYQNSQQQQQNNFVIENSSNTFYSYFQSNQDSINLQQIQNEKPLIRQQQQSPKQTKSSKKEAQNKQRKLKVPEINVKKEHQISWENKNTRKFSLNQPNPQIKSEDQDQKQNQSCFIVDNENNFHEIQSDENDLDEDLFSECLQVSNQILRKQEVNQSQNINEREDNQILPTNIMDDPLLNSPGIKEEKDQQTNNLNLFKQNTNEVIQSQNFNQREINFDNEILASKNIDDYPLNFPQDNIKKEEDEQTNIFANSNSERPQERIEDEVFVSQFSQQQNYSNQRFSISEENQVNEVNESFYSKCNIQETQEIDYLNRYDSVNNQYDSNNSCQNNQQNDQNRNLQSMDLEFEQIQISL